MTAITASRSVAGTTTFERSLLRASTALDTFVSHRLARRTGADYRSAAATQAAAAAKRGAAEAYATVGMLPR